MTEPSRETFEDDLTAYSVDDEDQLQPEDTLVDDDVEDVLDRGYSPADTDRGSRSWGTTAYEQAHRETIDQRLAQEEPDPNARYEDDVIGSPSGGYAGASGPDDDADSDAAAREVGRVRAGRLVASDEGTHEDDDAEVWASDVGVDGAGASAEEAAMHIVDDDAERGDDY